GQPLHAVDHAGSGARAAAAQGAEPHGQVTQGTAQPALTSLVDGPKGAHPGGHTVGRYTG
ncbi:hypothetical protein A7O68_14830, partial [Listeria monocytogenes]